MDSTRRLMLAWPTVLLAPCARAANAQDEVTHAILANPITRLNQGGPVGAHWGSTLHRNFPQLIEQGFAARSPAEVAQVLDGYSERELAALAQNYTNATMDGGHQPRLLDVFALRLGGGPRLGRLSKHFGFGPTYEAVNRSARGATQDFLRHTRPDWAAPAPGRRVGVRFADGDGRPRMMRVAGVSEYLDMTIVQIFQSFRAGPIGGLSVAASSWMTGATVWAAVYASYSSGYVLGTAAAAVIDYMAPSFYPGVGSLMQILIVPISLAPTSFDVGKAMDKSMEEPWGLTSELAREIHDTGGDYGAAAAWAHVDYGSTWDGSGGRFGVPCSNAKCAEV